MIELKADTLYEAIKEHVNIELRAAETTGEKTDNVLFISKFLAFDADKKIIIIDFPQASSVLELLAEDDPVVVKYTHKENPFIFNTKVLSIRALKRPGEPNKQVMIISLPSGIMGNERRSFLKLSTPPFEVEIKILKSSDIIKQIKDSKYTGVTLNISGGGIAIKGKTKNLPIAPGDVLELKINLPNKTIHIEAELLNVYESENTTSISYGLRFMKQKLDKLNFNRGVRTIIRYVVRRERELLSRR